MMIDIGFLVVVVLGVYYGFSKGIIGTVLTLLSYVFGVIGAVRFSPGVTDSLRDLGLDSGFAPLVGVIITFLGIMLLIRAFANSVENGLERANINFVNQAVGGFVLAFLFTWIFSGIVWFFDAARLISDDVKKQSQTYTFVRDVPDYSRKAIQTIQPHFIHFWNTSLNALDDMDDAIKRQDEDPIIRDLNDDPFSVSQDTLN